MKNMKKLVAALLVLTMVLALAGSAMAACKIKVGDCVKFTKNTVAYKHKGGKPTNTIVRKGSYAVVKRACDGWVELYLDIVDDSITRWFKTDNLKVDTEWKDMGDDIFFPIYVVYSNGGVGNSSELLIMKDDDADDELDELHYRISPDCYKHVKATSTVWLHKESSLKKNYGVALHKNDKVKYRRVYGFDSRFVTFYGVKYKGKCLWVSSEYSKLVK